MPPRRRGSGGAGGLGQIVSGPDALLSLSDLRVSVEGREIVRGVNLIIRAGEKHALMGPNGSGKSSLANALAGHPAYRITGGKALLRGDDISTLPADERARRGLFLGFQYPVPLPGVSVANFMRSALRARVPKDADPEAHDSLRDFRKKLTDRLNLLEMDRSFAGRYLNEGFSGGEMKRLEVLQMSMLEPSVAILDEPDSGLDIDAVKVVARNIAAASGPGTGILLVTHYQRILNYIPPDFVHILVAGRLVRSGGPELARALEEGGYDPFIKEAGNHG